MKVCVLRTHTEDMARIWLSLQEAGHTVNRVTYDGYPHYEHAEMVNCIKLDKPDLIVFIGAIEKYHQKPVPTIDTLLSLHDIAPMVHVCADAGEPAWWEQLEEYEKAKCFLLQIGLDGYVDTHGGVEPVLAPIVPKLFKPIPWSERTIDLGLVGEYRGSPAQIIMRYASAYKNAKWLRGGTYAEIADFICQCKMVLTTSFNSLENGHHLSPFIPDIAYAGACLLESKNDDIGKWFPPDSFYLYEDFKDVANIMKTDFATEEPMKRAGKFHNHFMDKYRPDKFWPEIVGRMLVS